MARQKSYALTGPLSFGASTLLRLAYLASEKDPFANGSEEILQGCCKALPFGLGGRQGAFPLPKSQATWSSRIGLANSW